MRADRLLAIACALAIAAALIVRIILLVQPIGGDPAIYSYVGARILEGAVPYRDVFEQKPPGILYTYAAAFWLAGQTMGAVQALDLVAWVLTLVAVAGASHALWRDRSVTWAAAALAAVFVNPTLQSGFKQVGQSETWIGLFATLALWAAVRAIGEPPLASGFGFQASARSASGSPLREQLPTPDARSPKPILWACLAGLCCGVACVYKYNALPYVFACQASIVIARGRGAGWPVAALLAGFMTPLAVMVLWFAGAGGLADLYESTVLYNLRYAGDSMVGPGFAAQAVRTFYVFATTNVLWLAGLLGVIVLLARAAGGDRRGVPLVAMLGAGVAAILLNAKFYPQYFLQILPLWAVAAGCWLAHAIGILKGRSLVARGAAVVAILLVCSPLVRHTEFGRLGSHVRWAVDHRRGALSESDYFRPFGGYGDGGDFSLLANVQMARAIAGSTTPEETVYIYGGEALVLFLAGRRSPSRFIWNDPFLTGGFAGRYTHGDLIRELDASRTPIFIVLQNDANLIDPRDSLAHFREAADLRAYVEREYQEVGWMEDFLVFVRRGHRAPVLHR